MSDRHINEKIDLADIAAENDKHTKRILFASVLAFMCLIGFSVYHISKRPSYPDPPELIPSVECSKLPNSIWIPEKYIEVSNRTERIEAYCGKK